MARIDELRQDGIAVARTQEGFDLAVIDVTHARFALADDAASIRALGEAAEASERRRRWIPPFLMSWMLKSAAKKSRLVRAMFSGESTFLDSITTYVMKLGAANLLPPYDSDVDRRFCSSPHCTMLRLRMQQMAKLMAARAATELAAASPEQALHLIEIAGGPAMDAINALLLMAKSSPELLRAREVVIHVLDLDDNGPFFGQASLAELMRLRAPLHGFSIRFEHVAYDWRDTEVLRKLVGNLTGAVVLAASEGGLFEYGSDKEIVANLLALGTEVRAVFGSVTRADRMRRRLIAQSRFKLMPRGLDGIRPLAASAGFAIGETQPSMWSDQVEFVPVVSGGRQ